MAAKSDINSMLASMVCATLERDQNVYALSTGFGSLFRLKRSQIDTTIIHSMVMRTVAARKPMDTVSLNELDAYLKMYFEKITMVNK